VTPARRLILASLAALSLLSSVAASLAQVPAPVPALPDSERRTAYSITASQCNCNVIFQLFGDATDYQNWVEVYLNGVRVNYNDATFGWTITSPSPGTLANLPRPITDAVLTFNTAQTGTVQIVGARRPRRTSQFQEGAGVPARNLNQVVTDITATLREMWDKTNDMTGRGLFSQPGNTMGPLPLPAVCVNAFLAFDGTGLNPLCQQIVISGTLATPGSTVNGDFAIWTGTNGKQLGDGGAPGTFAFQNYATPPAIGGTTPNTGVFTDIDSATLATGSVITSTPTVSSSYCGKTAALGGSAQYTFTVGAASGFTAGCVIGVANVDPVPSSGGRGKQMAINGVTFPLNGLYPGMAFTLKNINNAWVLVGLANRYKVPSGNFNLFTDFALGLDTNDGLAAGTGNAKKTIQACLDTIANDFDFTGWSGILGETGGPTIAACNLASGSTDSLGVHFSAHAFVGAQGGAAVLIQAAAGTATITSSTSDGIGLFLSSRVQLKNVNLASTGPSGAALNVGYSAEAQILSGVTFGTASNNAHISVSDNGIVRIVNGYTIAGNATSHYLAQGHGQILQQGGSITVSGSTAPAFSGAFALASNGGLINVPGITWSGLMGGGGATGKRSEADNLGNISTNAGATACSTTYFPGTSNGTTSNGGQCN
jgi:hypothetical protein